MLTASILKIFYWPGARYDYSLLIQAFLMVGVQITLLKVALDNRPGWRGEMPFVETGGKRPYGFWRWRTQRPYVHHSKFPNEENSWPHAIRRNGDQANRLEFVEQVLGIPPPSRFRPAYNPSTPTARRLVAVH